MSIVQSANSGMISGTTTSTTVTLTSPPTPGNTLIAIGGGVFSGPAQGFINISGLNSSNSGIIFQNWEYASANANPVQISVTYHYVQPGDQSPWTFTLNVSGVSNYGWGVVLIEVSGYVQAHYNYAANNVSPGTGGTTTLYGTNPGDVILGIGTQMTAASATQGWSQGSGSTVGFSLLASLESASYFGSLGVWSLTSSGGTVVSYAVNTPVNASNYQWIGAVVSLTPALMTGSDWEADSQQKSLEVGCINQFVSLHNSQVVYQGVLSQQTSTGNFNKWQTVGGYMIDQPFVANSSKLGFVRVPITNQDLPAPEVDFTGDITEGSNTIVNVSSIANLFVGMPLYATGIDSDTTIVAISSGVVTMSTYASATLTQNDFVAVADAVGYDHAVNISVGVYKDNAGKPGTLVSQYLVPSSIIESSGNSSWAEPQDVLGGVRVVDRLASFPQYQSTPSGLNLIQAGQYAVYIQGIASAGSPIWTSYYDGSDLTGWIQNGTLPPNTNSGGTSLVYCPNAQVLVASVDTSTTLWAATFNQQTGVIGAWQQLDSNPNTFYNYYSTLGVLSNSGTDYLFVIGGVDSLSNNSTNATYYTSINSNATDNGWSSGPTFPTATFSTYVSATQWAGYVNNYQSPSFNMEDGSFVVQDGTPYLEVVLGTTSITRSGMWKLSSPTSSWQYIGDFPQTVYQGMYAAGSLLTDLGSYTSYSLVPYTSQQTGIAQWGMQSLGGNVSQGRCVFENSDGSYTAFWCQQYGGTSYKQNIYPCNWVNVPIGLNNLTSGSTYHLVISGSTPNNFSNANVPLMNPVAGHTQTSAQISSDGGNTWTSLGASIPHLLFSTNNGTVPGNGGLLGFIEDNGARISTSYFGSPSLDMLSSSQWTVVNFPATLTGYTFTGNTTSGSNTITGIALTTGIVAGMVVSGTGIPVNTTVVSTTSTTITMNNNAQLSTNGLTFSAGSTTVTINGPLDLSPGMPVSGMGIPNNTSIVTVNNSSLVLNNAATMSCTTLFCSTTASVESSVIEYSNNVPTSFVGLL
jgi:hypothetical protein